MTSDYKRYQAELKAEAAQRLGRPVKTVIKTLHEEIIEAMTGNSVYSDEEAEKKLAYYVALSLPDCKESP
jgi:hypothetical protein